MLANVGERNIRNPDAMAVAHKRAALREQKHYPLLNSIVVLADTGKGYELYFDCPSSQLCSKRGKL